MAFIRRLLLAATAVVAAAAVIMPAVPAHAAGEEITICFPVGEFGDIEVWDCYTVILPEVGAKPPGPIGCLSCPPAVDFLDNLDPKDQLAYLEQLGKGLGLLGKAAVTEDPKEAKFLRDQAAEAFLASAESLGKASIKLDRVGWADLKNNEFFKDPTPTPALEATGQYLVEGLTLMQLAMGDPSPQPSLEEAMAMFDEAYGSLAELFAG